jgi:hypothetical protein
VDSPAGRANDSRGSLLDFPLIPTRCDTATVHGENVLRTQQADRDVQSSLDQRALDRLVAYIRILLEWDERQQDQSHGAAA